MSRLAVALQMHYASLALPTDQAAPVRMDLVAAEGPLQLMRLAITYSTKAFEEPAREVLGVHVVARSSWAIDD